MNLASSLGAELSLLLMTDVFSRGEWEGGDMEGKAGSFREQN